MILQLQLRHSIKMNHGTQFALSKLLVWDTVTLQDTLAQYCCDRECCPSLLVPYSVCWDTILKVSNYHLLGSLSEWLSILILYCSPDNLVWVDMILSVHWLPTLACLDYTLSRACWPRIWWEIYNWGRYSQCLSFLWGCAWCRISRWHPGLSSYWCVSDQWQTCYHYPRQVAPLLWYCIYTPKSSLEGALR